MAYVKWIKLSTSMFEDEKIRLIEALPESDTILIIWVKLLAQAGKTNASGYIFLNEHIPFTDEMLATIFNRPITTVRLALKTFEQFGMIEINDNNFISISNWEKHQNIDGMEKIREQNRLRKQKEREKKKLLSDGHVTVTQSHSIEVDIEEEREREKENIISATTAASTNFYDSYHLCFNKAPSAIQVEDIKSFIDRDGLNEEIICLAFKKASENGAGYPYARSIINSWANKGIKTIEDVKREQAEFEKKKLQNKQRKGKTIRTEQLPEWFDDEQQHRFTIHPKETEADAASKKQELEEILSEFRSK
jgi:predicted phage replisome organizer